MSRTLTIPDELFARLEKAAHLRGLQSVEQLLETWPAEDGDGGQRRQSVREIDAVRARMLAVYGEMPDSVDLLREDRER